jgi:alpha-tubulin suppressor-like RCC1 family protein
MQLGFDNPKDQKLFMEVPVPAKCVKTASGAEFSLAITTDGEVYSWGCPQYGQTGTGSDYGFIAGTNRMVYDPQSPKLVKGLEGKNIVQISCGTSHSLALDDEGRMFTWGFAAYGRLGLVF